ncbi:MAG TPA: EcsC family protein [Chitinophagaceae bacterium]|jgi:hypothetical protein|nr:EcsC family protein [Chitinophagaceae bacterium]
MQNKYEQAAFKELKSWQKKVQKKASLPSLLADHLQKKWNGLIPEKVHKGITVVIEKMVKSVLFGSKYATAGPKAYPSLEDIEIKVNRLISIYKHTASVEGAVAGTGGVLFGLAEFPVLISLKIKMLFDIAAAYGFDVKDYKERLYILYIFQLTFSSQQGREKVYPIIADWENYCNNLPDNEDAFDWRAFQQQYRDYIDLAKMAQLIPFIGAAVGFVVNKRLVRKLGDFAINCFRMRYFAAGITP